MKSYDPVPANVHHLIDSPVVSGSAYSAAYLQPQRRQRTSQKTQVFLRLLVSHGTLWDPKGTETKL